MTNREVLPGCARVRTKCAGKTSVGLWGRGPRELPGVNARTRGVVGVLHLVSEPTLAGCTGVCGSEARTCGPSWHMCRHWMHRRVPTGEVPGLGLIDEGVDLLRGDECDILAQGLIGLIEYSYQHGMPSFPEAHSQRTPRLSMLGLEQYEDG